MTDQSLSVNSMTIDPGLFRFGQPFGVKELRFIINRFSLGWNLTFGRVETAFAPGYDIVDDNDQVDEEKMAILEEDEDHDQHDFATERAIGAMHGYGWSILVHFSEGEKHRFQWYSLEDNAKFWMNDMYELDKVQFDVELNGYGISKTVTYDKPDELQAVYLLINETSKIGTARSYLEPIMDTLFALLNVNQSASLYCIRAGPGIPIAKVPLSILKDTREKANIDAQMGKVGINSKFIFPKQDGVDPENNFEFELYTGEGQVNFDQIYDILISDIAAYTEQPKEKFQGSERGLRSSETDKKYVDKFIEGDQEYAKKILAWVLNRKHDWELRAKHIKWRPYKELDEDQVMDQKKKQVEIIKELVSVRNQMGFKPEEILDYAGADDLSVHNDLIVEMEDMMGEGGPFGNNKEGPPQDGEEEPEEEDEE